MWTQTAQGSTLRRHCWTSSDSVARELARRVYPQAPSAAGTLESDSAPAVPWALRVTQYKEVLESLTSSQVLR